MGSLARVLVRWRWAVIALWVVVGVTSAIRAPGTLERLDVSGGGSDTTEAKRADVRLGTDFPQPLSEYLAIAVSSREPFDAAGPAALLDSLRTHVQRVDGVRGVLSWQHGGDSAFVSRDHRQTLLIVSISAQAGRTSNLFVPALRAAVREVVAARPDSAAYRAYVTGRGALDLDIRKVTSEDSRRGELRLFPLTLVILVLAFGALVAAMLPLVVGFLAIAISLTIIGIIAQYTPMSIFVLNMTTMIGLGVGIDYSLLVVTRFREELNRGLSRKDAAIETTRHAGAAVITSGLTVVVGFGALLLTPLVETRSVGLGGLIVVAVAVLLSVTLLPALLSLLGRAIDRPRWLARKLAWYHAPQIWESWARTLSRHPIRALVLGGGTIAILSAPVFLIRIGLPSRNWWPVSTEAGQGLAELQRMGVAGYVTPVRVIVRLPEGRTATEATSLRGLRALSDSFHADPRVREVRSIVDFGPRVSLLELSAQYSNLDSARARAPQLLDAYLSADGRTALMDVIPQDTVTLTTGMDLARRARALGQAPPKQLRGPGGEILVGGYVAASVDFQNDLLRRFPMIVALILAATAVMLAIAFKSVLIPIKAIVLNSLSVSATFGLVVLVFQYGVGARLINLDGPTSAIFVVVPVLVFAVVFGLSMDYEVFLLSRMKEAFDRTGKNREATMEGVSATASVITSAALIMLIVFGAFAFARLLIVQFLGFGLAVAVFLDATIIRMVLVPALMQIAGDWNWWPGRWSREKPAAPDAAPPP